MSKRSQRQPQIDARGNKKPYKDDDYDVGLVFAAGTITETTTTQIQSTSSTTNRNRALDSDVYGGLKITYANHFEKLQYIPLVNDRLGVGLIKQGLKLAKGYRLTVDPKIVQDESRQAEILAICKDLDQDLNTDELFCDAGFQILRDGNIPQLTTGEPGEGITDVEFLPMDITTFLPKTVKPGSGVKDKEELKNLGLVKGPVTQVVVNESLGKEGWDLHDLTIKDEIPRVTLMRLAYRGHKCMDIYGRQTSGIYGMSLVGLLDKTVKQYEDINWGFSKAIGRYGYGRHIYNDRLLEELIKNGKTSPKAAARLVKQMAATFKKMGPEEDIVGVGIEGQPLSLSISSDGGILNTKESFERDIAYGILETEASSNKAAGTTFASSRTADKEAIRVLGSAQRMIKRAIEVGIYARHLELLGGFSPEECRAVRIELDPLDEPSYTLRDLMDFDSMNPGFISPEQQLEMAGIKVPPKAGQPAIADDGGAAQGQRMDSDQQIIQQRPVE